MILHSLSLASSAFFLQTSAPGVDWLYQFTNNLTNLTTQNGDALSSVGMSLLAFVSLMKLVRMVVNWNISTMTISWSAQPVRVGDLVEFLLQLVVCLLIINYWTTPIPGASFGFNHLFSYFAQVIVAAFDQNSLTQLQNALSTALNGTPQPSYLAPMEILTYLLVYVFVGLAGGILFLINCSSFIFYGVAALFGPIFVPLLMTRTFRGKFYNFVDVLLSFAMIRAVAAAFIFVWSGFLITFLQQTFNGDYSLPMWIANLYGVIAVFIAFILNMTMVPTITQTLFGGGSGAAGRVAQFAEALLIRAAAVAAAA
jgi:TrbL/VirB6 plasmid conjugal transfer protein